MPAIFEQTFEYVKLAARPRDDLRILPHQRFEFLFERGQIGSDLQLLQLHARRLGAHCGAAQSRDDFDQSV